VAGSTVLVVDDEPRIVEFLLENLRADDYSVLTASNGEEAIDVLSRTRPDLILLDVVLPGMSGIDVCRRVRGGDAVNDPWDPNLPIIMLSAKAEHTDRVRGGLGLQVARPHSHAGFPREPAAAEAGHRLRSSLDRERVGTRIPRLHA
jgi:CheY-like chemotaxis protein